MQIFHYHPDIGVLVGTDVADSSPLEPGIFLVPAHATTEIPPACADGENAVFREGAWVVEAIPVLEEKVVVKNDAELWADYQQQAMVALDKTRVTIDRCFEAAIALPPDWLAYRKALRAIVGASSGDPLQALPSRPAYPAGT